jgi:hypothetical protein
MKPSWLLLGLLAACGNSRTTDKGQGPGPEAATTPVVVAPAIDASPENHMTDVTWRNFAIDDLGISLDVFAGDGVDPPSVSEGYLTQHNGPAGLSVAWGPGAGIEAWKQTAGDLPGQTISAVSEMEICGKPARTVTVDIPDRGTIRGKRHSKPMPARVLTMAELPIGDRVVLLSFFVETAAAAAYAGARTHFFASITCR